MPLSPKAFLCQEILTNPKNTALTEPFKPCYSLAQSLNNCFIPTKKRDHNVSTFSPFKYIMTFRKAKPTQMHRIITQVTLCE